MHRSVPTRGLDEYPITELLKTYIDPVSWLALQMSSRELKDSFPLDDLMKTPCWKQADKRLREVGIDEENEEVSQCISILIGPDARRKVWMSALYVHYAIYDYYIPLFGGNLINGRSSILDVIQIQPIGLKYIIDNDHSSLEQDVADTNDRFSKAMVYMQRIRTFLNLYMAGSAADRVMEKSRPVIAFFYFEAWRALKAEIARLLNLPAHRFERFEHIENMKRYFAKEVIEGEPDDVLKKALRELALLL